MSQKRGQQDGDSERLPWLEPYREPAKPASRRPPPQPATSRSRAPLVAIGAVAALTAAVGGGYWLGQRGELAPPSAAPAETRIADAAPVAPPAIQPMPSEPQANESPEAVEPAAPIAKPAVSKPKPKARRPVRRAKRIKAEPERSQYASVLAKQRDAARTWPKMPSPGPAGQVIQLGAFSTRARAVAAYRNRVERYPVLTTMPQVVVPIITQPKGQVLYVLRLGTRSREQSNVVCRNLRTSGDHCLVIG